jgi:hypothetical protein
MVGNQQEEKSIGDIGVQYLANALRENQVKLFLILILMFIFFIIYKDLNYAGPFFESNWRHRCTIFGRCIARQSSIIL